MSSRLLHAAGMVLTALTLLAAVYALAGSGDGSAMAYDRELTRSERDEMPVSDDPGYQYGNVYYRNCLLRRQSGNLRCGETCFWRECTRCRNICRMHCSCDDCPEDEDEDGGTAPATGGGGTAAILGDGNDLAVNVVYEGGLGGSGNLSCPVAPEAGPEREPGDASVMVQQSPKSTRVLPTREVPVGPVMGLEKPCSRYRDCDANLRNQIVVNGTRLLANFGVAGGGGERYVAGHGRSASTVSIRQPFALTFIVELGGTPEEGLTFPCEVRWRRSGGGSIGGLAYDSWHGPCRVGYSALPEQGFIAEVRPPVGGGSRREDFKRWLWPTGSYRVELVLDPGSGREYVLARRAFRVTDAPDDNPYPNQLNEFSTIDPGCPDCRTCGCDSRYGCNCDADSDCGCDCGGSCYCTSRCGSCIRWAWRGLGAVGSGRAPIVYAAGFNMDFRDGRRASSTSNRYWYAATPDAFSMARDVPLLVDHHYGAASRCRDVKGIVTEPQVFVDDSKWGADPVIYGEASSYSWLRSPGDTRTPVPDRTTTPRTQVPDRGSADGVTAPELDRRNRFSVCEMTLRRKLLELISDRSSGRSFSALQRVFREVRDRSGDGCIQPSPWPSSAPSSWDDDRMADWKKDVWNPGISDRRQTNSCPAPRTGYYPPGRLSDYPDGLLVVHWNPGDQGEGVLSSVWSTARLRCYSSGRCYGSGPGGSFQATGGTHNTLPSDGSGCWFYDYGGDAPGWQAREGYTDDIERHYARSPGAIVGPVTLSGGSVGDAGPDAQGLVGHGDRVRERFTGFVDSRPAPHLLVEWPVGDEPWLKDEHEPIVGLLAEQVRRNFVMGVNVDGETDLCGPAYDADWGLDSKGNKVQARVQVCWMRYAWAQLIPWVVKGSRKVPATVEVMYGRHSRLPSDLRNQKFPAYRDYGAGYSADPVSGVSGGLSATAAASGAYDDASCAGGRCVAPLACPHLNHRGMLRTSFTLQNYPHRIWESEGNVELRRLEDQHGSSYRHLLAYPSDPRAASGTDSHVGSDDGRREHDRVLKLNNSDYRIVTEEGRKVLYVEMPVVGAGTHDSGGRPVAVEEVRMPWVGYDRISGGSRDGWLRYTSAGGDVTTIDPSLLAHCRGVCPYLNTDADAVGVQRVYSLAGGDTARYTKQTVVGLGEGCVYEPVGGRLRCGDVDDPDSVAIEGYFNDLIFPYCPVPVGRLVGDVGKCSARVQTYGNVRTMEAYELPYWRPPGGRTVSLGQPCVE